MFRFQCPECGFGDSKVGRLVADTEIYCVVCLEEEGSLVSIHSWDEDETDQARFRGALVAASPKQLDVPQAEATHMVQPDRMADDLGRKAMAVVGVGWWPHAFTVIHIRTRCQTRLP